MIAPETRPSLVLRLKDSGDQQAWREFLEIYEPLVLKAARRRGLQDADAREVVQDVLMAVAGAMGRWECDPERGSFRGWLARITRNMVVNFLVRQARHPRGSGKTDFQRWIELQPSDQTEASAWYLREERLRVFHWAARQAQREFQESTWRAFWRTTVDAVEVSVVAAELNLSLGAVYVARSRVMRRLREIVEQATR